MNKIATPKLIAFDMDGTLLNSKKGISLCTLHYLRKLTKKGYKIILASGRPSRALYSYYYKLRLKTPMICYNGAYVFDPNDPNFPKIEYQFPKDTILEILNKIKSHTKNVMCETDDEIWVDKEDKFLDKFFWYKNMNVHYGELSKILDKDPMTCIVQVPDDYHDNEEVNEILKDYPLLCARHWVGCSYFEFGYKGTSKGNALKKICEYYKIPFSNVIVFGDATNDVEMFEIAGTSILMSNAKYDLKDKVTMVSLKDNDHNGIYHTLKKLLK